MVSGESALIYPVRRPGAQGGLHTGEGRPQFLNTRRPGSDAPKKAWTDRNSKSTEASPAWACLLVCLSACPSRSVCLCVHVCLPVCLSVDLSIRLNATLCQQGGCSFLLTVSAPLLGAAPQPATVERVLWPCLKLKSGAKTAVLLLLTIVVFGFNNCCFWF